MKYRELGLSGVMLSAIGLGCMGMSSAYGASNNEESLATLNRSLELGINFWDTADLYGNGANEELISKALNGNRNKVFIASKFGFRKKPGAKEAVPGSTYIDSSAAYVKEAAEASLRRLGVDTIDLYYVHRIDQITPIEETISAMADLAQAGKIRYLGLCEVDGDTLRRAHAVHPIQAIQSEYSLFTRDVESGVLPVAQELGISFISYAPLSRGLVPNSILPSQMESKDMRRNLPRYQGEYYKNNELLSKELSSFAQSKGISSAQLALAWLLSRGDKLIPIPGAKQSAHLEENALAVSIDFTEKDNEIIDQILERYPNIGPRY